MLEAGVNAVAVTAFICSLATVGLLHLPAEIAAPGWMFVAASPFILMSCCLCALPSKGAPHRSFGLA